MSQLANAMCLRTSMYLGRSLPFYQSVRIHSANPNRCIYILGRSIKGLLQAIITLLPKQSNHDYYLKVHTGPFWTQVVVVGIYL